MGVIPWVRKSRHGMRAEVGEQVLYLGYYVVEGRDRYALHVNRRLVGHFDTPEQAKAAAEEAIGAEEGSA